MRVLTWVGGALASVFAIACAALIAWHASDRSPGAAAVNATPTPFDVSRLLVLVDGDMSATDCADGMLYPIDGLAIFW